MLKIIIIEDNFEFCQVLGAMIDRQKDMSCLATFGSVPSAMKNFDPGNAPDILILDLGLPKVDGLTALPDLRKALPDTKILVLTISEDRHRVVQALTLGAQGYLLKTDPKKHILQGIRAIERGEAPMSPSIAQIVLQTFQAVAPSGDSNLLSEREVEVLRALADGQSRKQVADKLCISVYTVNSHVAKLYEKLHVNNLSSALKEAAKGGVI